MKRGVELCEKRARQRDVVMSVKSENKVIETSRQSFYRRPAATHTFTATVAASLSPVNVFRDTGYPEASKLCTLIGDRGNDCSVEEI